LEKRYIKDEELLEILQNSSDAEYTEDGGKHRRKRKLMIRLQVLFRRKKLHRKTKTLLLLHVQLIRLYIQVWNPLVI
jgi:hypothetical protein